MSTGALDPMQFCLLCRNKAEVRRGDRIYIVDCKGCGRGLPVIWMCRQDAMSQAHFDTSHFNYLTWKQGDTNTRERLATRIRATIGIGPKSPPSIPQ